MGQRSAEKQRPALLLHPVLTNPSPSRPFPPRRSKITSKSHQSPTNLLPVSTLISPFSFLPKSEKEREPRRSVLGAILWSVLHKRPGKLESCLISFQCADVKIWSCAPESGNEQIQEDYWEILETLLMWYCIYLLDTHSLALLLRFYWASNSGKHTEPNNGCLLPQIPGAMALTTKTQPSKHLQNIIHILCTAQ